MGKRLVIASSAALVSSIGASPAMAELPDSDGDGVPDVMDCGPTDASIYPLATEIPYDSIDQDCSGADLCDVDLDGFDAPECGGDDCDDNAEGTNPKAVDVPEDGIDQDCSGEDAVIACDLDGDGFLAAHCAGNDCNDNAADVNPEAQEIDADGIDQDCDGVDDCVPVEWAQGGWCSTGPVGGAWWLALAPLALLRRRRVA